MYNNLSDMAALAQRDMVQKVKRAKPAFARTLASTLKATRKKRAQLAGTTIPFVRGWAEGGGSYNPLGGETSMQRATKESFGAMYGGVVFRYMHMDLEDHMLLDMERGKLPDSYIDQRKRRFDTFMMEKNWAIIGTGTGMIAQSASATGTTLTLTTPAASATRGLSKGSYRFHVSTTDNPIYYSAINTTTELEVARFFVTAKLSATTVTVNFTGGIGAIADLNAAGLAIVKTKTGWKKEIIGYGGHFSNASTGIYQGADRAVDPWINASRIDGSGGLTPTLLDTAKNTNMTRGNDPEGRNGLVCRMATGNWNVLCAYGYTGSTKNWNVDNMKRSMKTYGLPADYEDGDTMFFIDPDYEDSFVDLHEMAPYFEYEQKEFGLKTTDGIGRHENVGAYLAGSTESYENYNEATNLVYDGRGNGEFEGNGKPNSAVFIDTLPMPAIRQSVYFNG